MKTVKEMVAGSERSHAPKNCSHFFGGLYSGGGGGGGAALRFANSRSFGEGPSWVRLEGAALVAGFGGCCIGLCGRGGAGPFGNVGLRGIIRERIWGLGGILAVEVPSQASLDLGRLLASMADRNC